MNSGRRPGGYTIVEVMVVLAISGVMFLIAATFISGKQQSTSFRAGVNQLASNIQDALSQVTAGQYSDVPFNCTATTPLTISTGGNGQGTNSGCTFIGKLFYFDEYGQSSQYELFSLAAARLDSINNPVSNLAQADVTVIRTNSGSFDLTQQQTVPQTLEVSKVTVTPAGGSPSNVYCGFGFTQGFSTTSSGSQVSTLVYAPNLACSGAGVPGDTYHAAQDINGHVAAASEVTMCITDGSRYATITLGNNNSQLSVATQLGLSVCP